MKPTQDTTQNMTTLSECITNAIESGYSENFKVTSQGLVSADEKHIYSPQQITISNFYRFEGYSNPDDNSILYLIETPDKRRGILVDAYGAYADAEISNFIRKIVNIRKE